MKKIKVYIASPYIKGDVALNVKRQIDIADILIKSGLVPFVPSYFHFQHMHHPQPYGVWLELKMVWISVCDCLLILDSESEDVDKEIEEAIRLEKPIFYSIEDLLKEWIE